MVDSIAPSADEYLTTGWEPDLDAQDTLVRQAVLVHASWATDVARATGRPWLRTQSWAAGWIGDRGALTNPVVLLRPWSEPEDVLAEVNAMFPDHVPYLLVSAWPTPDLTNRGLILIGHPPLLARWPGPPPSRERPSTEGPSTQRPSGDPRSVRVKKVADVEALAVAERVLVQGYPFPELEPLVAGDLLGPAILDGPTDVFLAEVDGQAAAVAAAHRAHGVTLVEFVAALPSARGRGAGAAVTWAATTTDPRQPAVLIASDEGRPVYERMGYVAVERWTVWLRPGGHGGDRV